MVLCLLAALVLPSYGLVHLQSRGRAACGAAVVGRAASALRMTLDGAAIDRLEEMRGKYDRLKNVVSEDAEKERGALAPTVEKYKTYVEVKILMGKLRMMYKSEASPTRKERQLSSFAQLYSGKLELEEILKEKLGLPFTKGAPKIAAMEEIRKLDTELSNLKGKLENVKLTIAPGMSTRDERFAR